MSFTPESAAQAILETIPLVMRSLRTALVGVVDIPNPGHFRLLHMLVDGPHNLSDLAASHRVTLPTMSNTVTALSARGLVRRSKSQEDRRRVNVELTAKGRRILTAVKTKGEAEIALRLGALTDEERRQLVAGLDVLKKAFADRNMPPSA